MVIASYIVDYIGTHSYDIRGTKYSLTLHIGHSVFFKIVALDDATLWSLNLISRCYVAIRIVVC